MPNRLVLRDVAHNFAKQGDFAISVPEFELAGGTISFLHGRSGSGKSTLFNILSGVITSIHSKVVREQCPQIGYIMHESTLLPWQTVADNLLVEAKLRDREPPVDDFTQYCRTFGLGPETQKRIASRLSLGMRQRIEIAKALSFNPDLLLLDEAFSGIDLAQRMIVRKTVREWTTKRNAIVLATAHQLSDLLRIADVVHVIEGGNLLPAENVGVSVSKREEMSNEQLLQVKALKHIFALV